MVGLAKYRETAGRAGSRITIRTYLAVCWKGWRGASPPTIWMCCLNRGPLLPLWWGAPATGADASVRLPVNHPIAYLHLGLNSLHIVDLVAASGE